MSMIWNVTHSYLSGMPSIIEADDTDDLMRKVQALADGAPVSYRLGTLTFEDYTDELHAFFVRGKATLRKKARRVRFMNLQAGG